MAFPQHNSVRRFTRALKPIGCSAALVLALALPLENANANVWVFQPSASLDQRFDDNYRLEPFRSRGVAATRAVFSGEVSRESKTYSIRGQARADGLLSVNEDNPDELSSNTIIYLDSKLLQPRSSWGLEFTHKRDTPSRDISADITDLSQTAADTGASVTQDQNIDRTRIVFNPSFKYNLSRLSAITLSYSFTNVEHGLPSVQDAIDRQVQAILANENAPQAIKDSLLALDRPAEINDIGRFTVADELDDFTENLFEVNYRRQISRIDSISGLVSYSKYRTESEIANAPESDRIPDAREDDILRNPREENTVDTIRLAVGFERFFSETLIGGIQLGYFTADSLAFGESETNTGYTAALTASKNAGIHRFKGKFGVEIFPSDIGDVVESLEVIGDYQRQISQLATFNLRLRAYEPDAVSDSNNADRFARRFFSMEPKIVWEFKRGWAAAGSYRYRRQKSQAETRSGQSHAILFSVKYTLPSAVADARRKSGLEN